METILNLGLNDRSVAGLAAATKNERFAYDAYRRFVQMYSTVVMGLSKEDLEHHLRAMKQRLGIKGRHRRSRERLVRIGRGIQSVLPRVLPRKAREQLWGARAAVVARGWGKCCVVGAQKLAIGDRLHRSTSAGSAAPSSRRPSNAKKPELKFYLRSCTG